MSESNIVTSSKNLWWFLIVGVVSIVLPIIGGALVIGASRLSRFRSRSPRLAWLALVWLAISVLQLIGLFVSVVFTNSTETVLR